MHIVYVVAPGGGPEACVRTLAPRLLKIGHRVTVIYSARAGHVSPSFQPDVRVLFAPPSSMHYYLSRVAGGSRAWLRPLRAWEHACAVYLRLREVEREEKIDLVEVVEGLPVNLFRKHWPVIVRAHGSDWTFRLFCQDGDQGGDHRLVEMEADQLRSASAVSAISRHLADHLSAYCQFPLNRIEVIPYPIETGQFRPADREDHSEIAVMAVGRLERRKGTDLLLRAMNRVWQEFPETKVYLIGAESGFTKGQLLELVPDDRRRQVVFPGFVDHDRLPDYYRRVTAYIAATQYETFAYTVLEAMASGLAVVATRTGAIPELVDDGMTGLLVPPGDPGSLSRAVLSLLEDGGRRNCMGQRARRVALADYSVGEIAGRMVDLYERASGG
ncbi:MAG: glycosyltransferase family 4 protein [Chloroflexi bacterium]|nr:glycosyltransferase family 4 protein [Chloroflexota bacterium]